MVKAMRCSRSVGDGDDQREKCDVGPLSSCPFGSAPTSPRQSLHVHACMSIAVINQKGDRFKGHSLSDSMSCSACSSAVVVYVVQSNEG
jgi:hypothetical protein